MGTLHIVSTPIGNLGDLSDRAKETFASADLVVAEDTRRTGRLLQHIECTKPLRSLHAHNEASRIAEVLDALEKGSSVALVSDAGTPLISDPGERVVSAVVEAGYTVVPIPGPSAVLASLVGSGLPCARFSFLGFVPRKGKERREVIDRIAQATDTVVVFESPERLVKLLETLADVIISARKVVVAREVTKLHEEFARGTVPELLERFRERAPKGEITVVIEGATPVATSVSDEDIVAASQREDLADAGMSAVAKAVAKTLGIPKGRAYSVLQTQRDKEGQSG